MAESYDEIRQRLASGETADVTSVTQKRVQIQIGGDRYSVAMRNLRSFRPIGKTIRSLTIESDHPLLREFHEPVCELYIYARPPNVDLYLSALRDCTKKLTHRSLRHFANDDRNFRRLLEGGQGLLLRGPRSLVEGIQQMSQEHGVNTSILETGPTDMPRQVLIADDNWLIADRFTFRKLGQNE